MLNAWSKADAEVDMELLMCVRGGGRAEMQHVAGLLLSVVIS